MGPISLWRLYYFLTDAYLTGEVSEAPEVCCFSIFFALDEELFLDEEAGLSSDWLS